MFITDGLSGMPQAVREVFPNFLRRRCAMHYARNLRGYVGKSEGKAIADSFRKVCACLAREGPKSGSKAGRIMRD